MRDYLKKIGQNVRAARMQAGLRQIDVNERIGLTYRHYQNIEAGRVNVSVFTLCRLARLFNSSMKMLVEECDGD